MNKNHSEILTSNSIKLTKNLLQNRSHASENHDVVLMKTLPNQLNCSTYCQLISHTFSLCTCINTSKNACERKVTKIGIQERKRNCWILAKCIIPKKNCLLFLCNSPYLQSLGTRKTLGHWWERYVVRVIWYRWNRGQTRWRKCAGTKKSSSENQWGWNNW